METVKTGIYNLANFKLNQEMKLDDFVIEFIDEKPALKKNKHKPSAAPVLTNLILDGYKF